VDSKRGTGRLVVNAVPAPVRSRRWSRCLARRLAQRGWAEESATGKRARRIGWSEPMAEPPFLPLNARRRFSPHLRLSFSVITGNIHVFLCGPRGPQPFLRTSRFGIASQPFHTARIHHIFTASLTPCLLYAPFHLLRALSQILAKEFGKHNIHVSTPSLRCVPPHHTTPTISARSFTGPFDFTARVQARPLLPPARRAILAVLSPDHCAALFPARARAYITPSRDTRCGDARFGESTAFAYNEGYRRGPRISGRGQPPRAPPFCIRTSLLRQLSSVPLYRAPQPPFDVRPWSSQRPLSPNSTLRAVQALLRARALDKFV
jgi:hypothetical protein